MADPPPYPNSSSDTGSTPRWVKVFGIIIIVLVLLFVVLQLTGLGGHHGPGRHTPSSDAGGQTPPSSVIGDAPPKGGYG